MPEQQRETQGPGGLCEPSGSPGIQFKSNQEKFKIQNTEGALIRSGGRKPGLIPVIKIAAPLSRARAGRHKRGGGLEQGVVGQSLRARQYFRG